MPNKELSRLRSQLQTTGVAQKNNPLFQVVDQFIQAVSRALDNIPTANPATPTDISDQTYLTATDESAQLPNSRHLTTSTGISFDDSVANVRAVSSTIPDLSAKHFATVTDESATLTNSRQLLAGVGVSFDDSVANQRTMSIASGSGFLTGVVNPQGVQAAGIGTWYINTVNGYAYQKVGGGSTAYGWYLVPPAGFPGPIPWRAYSGGPGAANAITGSGSGPLSTDGVATLALGAGTGTISIIGGKTFSTMTSGAVTTNAASVVSATAKNYLTLDDDIDLFAHISMGSTVAAVRFWFALTSASAVDTDTLGSASNGSIGIRFSTVGSDAGFRGATQINGGANQTLTSNSGTALGAVTASTVYKLRIRFVRQGTPTAYFSVNDGTEAQITTNIPATGNNYFMVLGVATQANVAKAVSYRSFGAMIGS